MSFETGMYPGGVAALEASKRLERSRRAALSRALAEKRRSFAAQMALSLAEALSQDATAPSDSRAGA